MKLFLRYVDLSKIFPEGITSIPDNMTMESNNDWRKNVSHTRKKKLLFISQNLGTNTV